MIWVQDLANLLDINIGTMFYYCSKGILTTIQMSHGKKTRTYVIKDDKYRLFIKNYQKKSPTITMPNGVDYRNDIITKYIKDEMNYFYKNT